MNVARMRFEFRCVHSLPRLAWCARLCEWGDRAVLLHGPWVETRGDWFVEGAWNGPFSEGRFDRAHTLVGTGGRIGGSGLVFCTPSSFAHSLYTLRLGAERLVSNSLAFLLVQAGDDLDPSYRHCAEDLAEFRRRGLRKREKTLRTRLRNRISVHQFTDIAVSPDLSLRELAKADCAAPRDFAEYDCLLGDTLAAVVENAGDRARAHRYRPVAVVSRGYDSSAAAALAARAGCREALTLGKLGLDDPEPDDGGAAIAASLGMETREYSRLAFKRLPGVVDAEFCACPAGGALPLAVAEGQAASALLINGLGGDAVWSKDRREHPPQMRRLRRTLVRTLIDTSTPEFRMRVGFLTLPVPWIGARHRLRIWEVTTSAEMKPWSIGGSYDRPIPRRIAEEAGVPREWFGRRKSAGLYHLFERDGLSPAGQEDFAKFCETIRRPVPLAERLGFAGMRVLYSLLATAVRRLNKLGDRLAWKTVFTPPLHGRYSSAVGPFQFTFHWGIDRMKSRYEVRE
jgi:hypothetical protein